MKTSFKVVIVALVLLVGLMGAGKTTAQVTQYPGTPLTPSAQAPLVITLDEGKLITLPGLVVSGDVVMLETVGTSCVSLGGNMYVCVPLPPISTWSDVIRFCDDPYQDPCQSPVASHVQVMSSAEEGASTFTDEYTGHLLDASKVAGLPPGIAIVESTTGPTPYGPAYLINSPEFGPAPVGGIVMPANTLALAAPWLAVIGVVGCIGTIVVIAKKREK